MQKSWIEKAEEIFTRHEKAMHVSELAEIAKVSYNLEESEEKIKGSFTAALAGHLKRFGKKAKPRQFIFHYSSSIPCSLI